MTNSITAQLFEPNINEIGGKYYDFSAKNNPSFVQTAAELKALGIKNFYFMLEIKNPQVLYINPFSPNLTEEQMRMIMIEASQNLWYFARCLVRVRTDAGIKQFELHRGLCSALWAFLRGFDWCLCEPRQTWKTSGTIGTAVLWAFQFSQDLNIHFFGKDNENTKRNLATLRDDIDLLPPYLQFKSYKNVDGKIKQTRQSTEILMNELMHNKLTIHSKANNESSAMQKARGASAAIIYFDEIEFTPFFDIILANSAPTFKVAADNAKEKGRPFGRLMTSTPNC